VALEKGDSLFAYTDGVTDAANLAGENFNVGRLVALFGGEPALSMLLENIHKQIEDHASGVQQTDDTSMLAVRRKNLSKGD